MFEKPTLFTRNSTLEVYTPVDMAGKLQQDLDRAGFQATLLDGEYGTDDLNDGSRTEIVIFQFQDVTDRISLRKFLLEWSA